MSASFSVDGGKMHHSTSYLLLVGDALHAMMMVARDVGHFDESTGHIAARVQQKL